MNMKRAWILLAIITVVWTLPVHADQEGRTGKPPHQSWYSAFWPWAEEKKINQREGYVTVTPIGDSRYPSVVLKEPLSHHRLVSFYFWEGVKSYKDGKGEQAIESFERARLSDPDDEGIRQTLHVVTEAHQKVRSSDTTHQAAGLQTQQARKQTSSQRVQVGSMTINNEEWKSVSPVKNEKKLFKTYPNPKRKEGSH
jgi:hypothetical protein